jgi:hypothetical protein
VATKPCHLPGSANTDFRSILSLKQIPDAEFPSHRILRTTGVLLNNYYWIDPTKRVAAVFMTQVLPFADRTTLSLSNQFERGIYSAVNAAN